MKTKIISAVVIVLVIVALIFMGGESPKDAPVTIGGFFNLTGFAAFAGEGSRDGFTMAVEDSALSSSTVRIVVENAASDLKQAVSGAKKLIEFDKAIAVIGPEWTEFGEVVAPVAVAAKVPFISPWIVAEAPFVKPPYYWSASPSYRVEYSTLAAYMSQHGLHAVAVVYSNNAWSYAALNMFKQEIAKYPEIHITSEQGSDQTTRDFRSMIAKIKAEKPDIIFSVIAEDEGYGVFLVQARQAGITIPISTFSVRATSPVLRDRFKGQLAGQIFAESLPAERAAEFARKYEKRFGRKVGAESAAATYDMTTIVLKAIKEGARSSEDIISYLKDMPAFEGYSGTISYDEHGMLPPHKAEMKRYNEQAEVETIR